MGSWAKYLTYFKWDCDNVFQSLKTVRMDMSVWLSLLKSLIKNYLIHYVMTFITLILM